MISDAGETIAELVQWLLNIDRSFAFLLALPFLVAAAGLLAELVKRNRAKPSVLDRKAGS